KFEGGLAAQALFDRGAPLLYVFGGSMRIERGKADCGFSQGGGREIQRALRLRRGKQGCRRSEIVELLGLRENVGDIVALIAPGVEVHRSEKDAVGSMEDEAKARKILRDAETGSEVVLVGIHQSAGIAVLSADENLRRSAGENEIGIGVADVHERAHVFVAHPHLKS